LLAGIANITAIIIQNLAVINNPSYVPQTWHVTLLMIAMLTIQGKHPACFQQTCHRADNI
jgi:choline transport protein